MLTTFLKRQIKAIKKHSKLTHSQSQELLARSYRCADYHELQQLVKSNPEDVRLIHASFNPASFAGTADDWELTLTHQSTVFARELGLPITEAGDLAAQVHGFSDRASIDYQTLDDLISSDEVFYQIDGQLSDEMSGDIASTNAYGFAIDDYHIVSSDQLSRHEASVTLDIIYTGEQHPDKPYSGSQFHPRVDVIFVRENGVWVFEDLSINTDVSYEEDNDIDWLEA